jgi:DNA ligase-1
MLASAIEDIKKLKYPLIASPKLDGIRAILQNNLLVSRTFKPIPNRHIRNVLESLDLDYALDGELVSGSSFNESSSAIMSRDGQPDFSYYVFDSVVDTSEAFLSRIKRLQEAAKQHPTIKIVEQEIITSSGDLLEYERKCLDKNFEGVMVRDPSGSYKFGRSSLREGLLLKLKRFEDSEAVVLGCEEMMHNTNPEELDAFGNVKRSTAMSGMVGSCMLGAFLVRDLVSNVDFAISTGLTERQRVDFWNVKDSLVGKIIKYRHQPSGALEKPRFPIFEGFRHTDDL